MTARAAPLIVLLLTALLLSACAGTARGVKQSVYRHDASVEVVDHSRSEGDALVVIRYPAAVEDEALPNYLRAFRQHPIGGGFEPGDTPPQESDRIAQGIITKSNFYVMSLYRELRDRLPKHSVLLSPHVITLDGNQRLASRPLLAAEEAPSVVTIDFSVYSHPDPTRMMDAPPLTFGDIVTPLFVIHADRWLRPSTHGLLLASEILAGPAWLGAREQAEAQAAVMLDPLAPRARAPLAFVTWLGRGDPGYADLPLKSPAESRREVVAVEVYPLEKIRMDAALMDQFERGPPADPFAEEFVKGAATRIAQALNRADHDRATFFARQAALARFDPQLGRAFLSRSRNEDLRARLQMGEALLRAERAFLSTQSARLFEGVWEGVFGDQMREMIMAEYRMLEERRDLARAQNFSTALAIVAMAGAVYAGSDADSGNVFHSRSMGNLATITSLWAMNAAFARNAESKTVGQNFLAQMAPAINRQVSVQMEWLGSTEQITARDFDEFRARTLALYQRSVRALDDRYAAGCVFRHPAVDEAGAWYGRCRDGHATGSGYGVVIDARGNTVEYLGAARRGLADGAGAMIFRSPDLAGAVYYEGDFAAGQPHGVVRVEQPGRRPEVRRFEAGVDRGRADEDALARVDF
jgi:predicted small secreted protein